MFPCSSETSQIATRKGLAPKPPNEDAVGGNGRRKRSAQEESQAEVQDDGHRSSSSSNSNNNSNNNSNSNSSNSNSSSSKSSKSSNSLPRRSITLRQAHAALMRKEHQIKPEALLARLQAGGVFLVRLQKRGGVGRGGEFRYPCYCWVSDDLCRLEWCSGIFRHEGPVPKNQSLDLWKWISVRTGTPARDNNNANASRPTSRVVSSLQRNKKSIDGTGDVSEITAPMFFLSVAFDPKRREDLVLSRSAPPIPSPTKLAHLCLAVANKAKYGPKGMEMAMHRHELWLFALQWLHSTYAAYVAETFRSVTSASLGAGKNFTKPVATKRKFSAYVRDLIRRSEATSSVRILVATPHAAAAAARLASRPLMSRQSNKSPTSSVQRSVADGACYRSHYQSPEPPCLPSRDEDGSMPPVMITARSRGSRIAASIALTAGLVLNESQVAFLDSLADEVCDELLRDGPESIAAALGLPRENFSPKRAQVATNGKATSLVDHIRETLKGEHFVDDRAPNEIAIPSHRIERTPSEFSPRFVTLRDCKNPGHSSPPPPMPDDTMHEARGDLRSAARDSEQNDEFGGFKKSTTPLKHHAFEIVSSPPPLPQRDD